jgi:hypothetical protein
MSDIFTEYPETGRAENERLRSTIDRLQAELTEARAALAKKTNDAKLLLEGLTMEANLLAAVEALNEAGNNELDLVLRNLKVADSEGDLMPAEAAEKRQDALERAEAESDMLRAAIDNMRAMNVKLTYEATGKVLAAEERIVELEKRLNYDDNQYELLQLSQRAEHAEAEVTKKHLELCEYQTQLDATSTALGRAEAALEQFSSVYVGEMDDDDIIAVKVKHVRKAHAVLAKIQPPAPDGEWHEVQDDRETETRSV